jgi:hypothetical protein
MSVISRIGSARREDVGAARDVLLQDVVLDRAADASRGTPCFVGDRHVEREQDRGGRVDRHRGGDAVERDPVEQRLHVLERVDRDADPAHLARAIGSSES